MQGFVKIYCNFLALRCGFNDNLFLLSLKLALLSQLLEEGREHSAAFVTADAYICLHLMIELLHLQ